MGVTAGFNRFGGVQLSVTTLPGWGKTVLLVFAVPGLLLLGLSAVAVAASLLVLLLTVGPVFWLLLKLFGERKAVGLGPGVGRGDGVADGTPAGRRRIDATVVEGE
ncbi:MAG: hypothetical protein ACFCVE_00700 [Phycisphaerae bacterium]